MSSAIDSLKDLIAAAAAINPLILIALFSAGFLAFGFLRAQWISLLLGAYCAFLLAILLSPGGRMISASTERMPEATPRAKCLGAALRAGALWDSGAVAATKSCAYSGIGFPQSTDKSEAKKDLSSTQMALSAIG